ncbi:MAG: hypothetical protein ACLSE6_03820 [Alphaproteobacteria bacterium]
MKSWKHNRHRSRYGLIFRTGGLPPPLLTIEDGSASYGIKRFAV